MQTQLGEPVSVLQEIDALATEVTNRLSAKHQIGRHDAQPSSIIFCVALSKGDKAVLIGVTALDSISFTLH